MQRCHGNVRRMSDAEQQQIVEDFGVKIPDTHSGSV